MGYMRIKDRANAPPPLRTRATARNEVAAGSTPTPTAASTPITSSTAATFARASAASNLMLEPPAPTATASSPLRTRRTTRASRNANTSFYTLDIPPFIESLDAQSSFETCLKPEHIPPSRAPSPEAKRPRRHDALPNPAPTPPVVSCPSSVRLGGEDEDDDDICDDINGGTVVCKTSKAASKCKAPARKGGARKKGAARAKHQPAPFPVLGESEDEEDASGIDADLELELFGPPEALEEPQPTLRGQGRARGRGSSVSTWSGSRSAVEIKDEPITPVALAQAMGSSAPPGDTVAGDVSFKNGACATHPWQPRTPAPFLPPSPTALEIDSNPLSTPAQITHLPDTISMSGGRKRTLPEPLLIGALSPASMAYDMAVDTPTIQTEKVSNLTALFGSGLELGLQQAASPVGLSPVASQDGDRRRQLSPNPCQTPPPAAEYVSVATQTSTPARPRWSRQLCQSPPAHDATTYSATSPPPPPPPQAEPTTSLFVELVPIPGCPFLISRETYAKVSTCPGFDPCGS